MMSKKSLPVLCELSFNVILFMQKEFMVRYMETLLMKQKNEYLGKLKKCKVRFGMGEIDEEIYEMTNKDLQEKLENIERGLAECRKNLSNLDSEVDDILAMCCNLDSLWRCASLETCQKLQNLLFPNGILWDKEKTIIEPLMRMKPSR